MGNQIMSNNGAKPIPFQAPTGTTIVGQPFTILGVGVPVNAKLKCNCGGLDTEVSITNSQAASCPSCLKSFNALFNPINGQLKFQIGVSANEGKNTS
jgi:hypothetical protein